MSIAHRTVGSGPHTVLCLPGWFGSSTGWGSFPSYVDGEAFTYVFVDYRGYGARRDEAGDYTLEEIAADVLALADELGVERFSLIGHSMGGSAVQRVLSKAPERVVKMVGIAPVGASPMPFDEAGHALFYGAAESRDNRYGIIDFTTGNRNTSVWVNQVVEHSLAGSTVDSFAGHLVAWATADFQDEVMGMALPVLAVVGEHDPALGEATIRATWVPTYPNCEVAVMANAGHYPMDETPVQLATVIERFLTT
ncbi:MAG TPA: alpha/beta hydrolase [Candidatus Lustribacter sp.]|nr:alpha/beta hydrolase [Candidatus Lustribacter sp.]